MWRHSLSIKTGNSLWDTDDTDSHRPISVDLRPSVSSFCVAVAPQYELSISNETDGDDHVKKATSPHIRAGACAGLSHRNDRKFCALPCGGYAKRPTRRQTLIIHLVALPCHWRNDSHEAFPY